MATNGAQGEPKWSPNGAQMEPKWCPIGSKLGPDTPKFERKQQRNNNHETTTNTTRTTTDNNNDDGSAIKAYFETANLAPMGDRKGYNTLKSQAPNLGYQDNRFFPL